MEESREEIERGTWILFDELLSREREKGIYVTTLAWALLLPCRNERVSCIDLIFNNEVPKRWSEKDTYMKCVRYHRSQTVTITIELFILRTRNTIQIGYLQLNFGMWKVSSFQHGCPVIRGVSRKRKWLIRAVCLRTVWRSFPLILLSKVNKQTLAEEDIHGRSFPLTFLHHPWWSSYLARKGRGIEWELPRDQPMPLRSPYCSCKDIW